MSSFDSRRCYTALKESAQELAQYCLQSILSQDAYWGKAFGWDATPTPMPEVLAHPVLAQIHQRFPIMQAGVLRLGPHRSYSWHLDQDRGASINMLLSAHQNSHCWFGKRMTDPRQVELLELEYQPHTLYLFNTQWPHSVFNFNQERYLFSLEFEQSKESLSYKQLFTWLQQEQLLESTA